MQDNDDLIGLIKEISSSNYKLKSEVLSYKEQLAESRSEIIALAQKLDDRNDQIAPTLEDDVKPKRTLTMPQKAHSTTTVTTAKRVPKRATSIKENPPSKPIEIQKSPDNKIAPTPTMSNSMPTSSSSPVVHHHYHYYLKNKENNANAPLLEEKDENETSSKSDISSNNDSMEFNNDASKKVKKKKDHAVYLYGT